MKLKKDVIERLFKLNKKYKSKPILEKIVIKDNKLLWATNYFLLKHYYYSESNSIIYVENNQIKTIPYDETQIADYDGVIPNLLDYEYFSDLENKSEYISKFIAKYAIKYKQTVDYKKIEDLFSLINDKTLYVYIHKKQNTTSQYPLILSDMYSEIGNYFLLMPVKL